MIQYKFYTVATIPIILFMISFLQYRTPDHQSSISEHAEFLEVPDYIYSEEYRMIIEKTYMDIFGARITDSMRLESATWLGYCSENINTMSCSHDLFSEVKCGDKFRWGEKIFCIPW